MGWWKLNVHKFPFKEGGIYSRGTQGQSRPNNLYEVDQKCWGKRHFPQHFTGGTLDLASKSTLFPMVTLMCHIKTIFNFGKKLYIYVN